MVMWGLGLPFWGLVFGLLTRAVLQFSGINVFSRVAIGLNRLHNTALSAALCL